jgi:hypothetical protein
MWWTDYGNSTQCKTRTKFTISQCMVYFPDPVKINLRKPFIQIRYSIIGKLHNTKSQVLLPILNLQYRSMVKSDPVINSCASSNYTYQLPSNNFTYSRLHANFNYDISTMDLHIKTQNNARIIRVHLLYNIFRHGLLSRLHKRNPLDK